MEYWTTKLTLNYNLRKGSSVITEGKGSNYVLLEHFERVENF